MFRTGKHAHAASAVPATSRRRLDATDDDDAGFTLIEAIVSFTIFAIVTAAAVSAIVAGIKTTNNNRDRVTAANVAQQAIADLQAAPATGVPTAPATTTTSVGSRSYTVARQVSVEASPSPATPTAACPSAVVTGTAYWLHYSIRVTWPGGPSGGVAMDTVRSC